MTAKHEWILLAVLVIITAGGYYKLGFSRTEAPATGTEVSAPSVAGTPGFVPDHLLEANKSEGLVAAEAPILAAVSHSEGLPTLGHWRGKPFIADLDNDGRNDLCSSIRRWDRSTPAEGIYVWRRDDDGKWIEWTDGMRRDMGYGGAAYDDINNDGLLDIAFSGHDVIPHVFLAEESERWLPIASGIDMEVICSDVALGDITGDGNSDLAVLGFFPQEGGLVVYAGDGYGNFERVEQLLDEVVFGQQVKFLDIDGDDAMELLATTSAGVKIWSYDAEEGTFINRSEGLLAPDIGGSIFAVDTADLDGDGAHELLVAGIPCPDHVAMEIYRWEGESWVSWATGLPNDEAFFDAEFAQLDPGGPLSIVAAGKNGINIIDEVGPGEYARRGRIEDTIGVFNLCTGDLTEDGRDEVVFVGIGGVRVLELTDDAGANQ